MYDRDSENNLNSLKETVKLVFFFKTIVGTILLLFGIAIAWEVVQTISTMIDQPEQIRLVEHIIKMTNNGSELSNQLPSEFSRSLDGSANAIIAYVILLFLLSIVGGIAKTFLTIGAELIKSDLKALLEKLGEELARLWKKNNA
jgi:predicted PurR-regulated permease PerM